MLLSDSDKAALIPALLCYVDFTDDFNVKYGIIESSYGDDITYGISPDEAYSLVKRLSLGNPLIEDYCIGDILSIVLTYKAHISLNIKDPSTPPEELPGLKEARGALNSLIRSVKEYCADNDIEIYD